MKKIVFMCFLALAMNQLHAQVYEYHDTDVKPAFKVCDGLGEATFECFMGEISRQVIDQMPNYEKKIGLVKGEVFATFIVNKEGKIEVSSVEGDNRLTDPTREMLTNVKDIIPAKKNGQNVSVQLNTCIPFLWLK